MKQNWTLYGLMGLTIVSGTLLTVVGFLRGMLVLQILGIGGIVIAVLGFLTFGPQGNFIAVCDKLFEEGKYEEERALIEKKMKSPLWFTVRIVGLQHYIRVCMALDDLPTAARYIDRLRHNGGLGWKYRTAYCYILILLDRGDLHTACTEFEEFRRDCAHAEIYKTQIEILTAVFSRLLTARNAQPLPAAAVESSYPVVSRILGRHYEAQVAASDVEWN